MKSDFYKKPKIKNEVFWGGTTLEELLSSDVVSVKTMRSDSVVMSCVNAIATYIASMSCHLYRKEDLSFNRVENNVTDILSRPNKLQGQFEFIKEMVIEMLIHRDSFAMMNFQRGKLISLEPIHNATLSEKVVGSNIWHVTGSIHNQYVDVPYENVIHFRDLFDRFEALRPILESKIAANKLVNKAFESGLNNNIKAWIELQGNANDDTKIKLKKAFNKVLQSENDSIAVLDEGMKLNPISGGSHSFQESQVVPLIKDLDNKIHQVMNVPSVITSIAEGAFNISDNLKSIFVQSLMPFIKMIEQEFNEKLLTRSEKQTHYFKLNYQSLLRGNNQERMNFYQSALNCGIMTRAEARCLEDLPYIEGTEELLVPLNNVTLSNYDEYVNKVYGLNGESVPNEGEPDPNAEDDEIVEDEEKIEE